jgi:biotin operon repressor
MNNLEKEALKARLLKLAILKSTGSPSDLAAKLAISERSVKRFVKELRDEGQNITYCQSRRSYVTDKDY